MHPYNWIVDFRGETRANLYRIKRVIVNSHSEFQEIMIADTADFGRALFLDGIPQSSALDEHIYHESLVHPALVANPQPRRVLIAGGGEGATLREVLKHDTVERVVVLDIDTEVIQLARHHMNAWHSGAFDDARVELHIGDARKYLANSEQQFDCIILDMPDPLEGSPAAFLFTQEFFTIIRKRLNPRGTLGMQAEAAEIADYRAHTSIVKTLQTCFDFVSPYQTWISFYGLTWGFAVASNSRMDHRLNAQVLDSILRERECLDLKFYDAESHLHMFSRPRYLRDALEDPEIGQVIRDDRLLIVG